MALMFAHSELTPMPDCAIFADTGAEPKTVYRWLEWLTTKLPFPVHVVSGGDLSKESLSLKTSQDGDLYIRNVIPAFTRNQDGSVGMMMRKCTADYKVAPLKRKQRELLKESGEKKLISYIGISYDELIRMKPSGVKYAENRWPLVEIGMRRLDCLTWMQEKGYPEPPRSACVFCPYHSDAEWRRLKNQDPEGFADAVEFERAYQSALSGETINTSTKGVPYLHRSLLPIDQADFSGPTEHGQVELFGDECEGMCGV